jgi:lysophospholipase L1-like esterase
MTLTKKIGTWLWLAACMLGLSGLRGGELRTAGVLEQGEPVRIVCFGDSITGLYYHTGGRLTWSHLLEASLKEIYPQARIEIVNAGISGNTTADALRRLDADGLTLRPHLVAAMFGMNDVAKLESSTFRQNLVELVARVRASGAEIVLMTPNPVEPGDPRRPPERVADYARIVREVGTELSAPVADGFRRFQTAMIENVGAEARLMSDGIHPNLRGHALFASEVAGVIAGRPVAPIPPALRSPDFSFTLDRLRGGKEVRVLAMAPFDTLIGPVLRRLFPSAHVHVESWTSDGKSPETIAREAKSKGWWRFRETPDAERPQLVIVAMPPASEGVPEADYFKTCTEILNWSASFAKPEWDLLSVLPSVVAAEPSAEMRRMEEVAVGAIVGQGGAVLRRDKSDTRTPEDLLLQSLRAALTR